MENTVSEMFNELGVEDSSVAKEGNMEELILREGASDCDR